MKAKIIRANEGKIQDFGNMKLKEMLDYPEWPFSVNWIERTSDETREGWENEQTVAFYALEGEGTVIVDGEEQNLSKGDLVAFPKGVRWKFLKGLTLLAISHPPYDRTKRKYSEY